MRTHLIAVGALVWSNTTGQKDRRLWGREWEIARSLLGAAWLGALFCDSLLFSVNDRILREFASPRLLKYFGSRPRTSRPRVRFKTQKRRHKTQNTRDKR